MTDVRLFVRIAMAVLAVVWLAACDSDSSGDLVEGGATTTTSLVDPPSSTLTDTTTTSTTVTTTTSSVTLFPPSTVCSIHSFGCRVRVRLTSSEQLGSLQFDLDYPATGLRLEGSADNVSCSALAGTITTFNDDEAASTLRVGMISLTPFAGPAIVADCIADLGEICSPIGDIGSRDDLELRLVDAADPTFNPVTPTLELETLGCFPGDPPLF